MYKYLIVNLAFFHLVFFSDNFFPVAPFPDHCLLVYYFFLKIHALYTVSQYIMTRYLIALRQDLENDYQKPMQNAFSVNQSDTLPLNFGKQFARPRHWTEYMV